MKKKKAKKKRSTKKFTPRKTAQKKFPKNKKVAKKKTPPKKKIVKVKAVQRRPTEEERKQFNKERRRAKEYVTDKRKMSQLLEEAIEKAERNKSDLKKVWEGLLALFRLIREWLTRKYTQVPLKTILWIIAAIIYFVNPFDVIPDFIPGFGYIDDASVIAFVLNSIRGDLDTFLEWERSKK